MRSVRLLFCVAYACLLTVLLLVPQPAEVVGLRRTPRLPWGDIGIHFTAFTILTLLVHGLRWPRRARWPFVAALLTYGLVTESLQLCVPSRSVELLDYLENVLGVAVGTGLYWLARRLLQQRLTKPGSVAEGEKLFATADVTAD